jgi:hypothetical protein
MSTKGIISVIKRVRLQHWLIFLAFNFGDAGLYTL